MFIKFVKILLLIPMIFVLCSCIVAIGGHSSGTTTKYSYTYQNCMNGWMVDNSMGIFRSEKFWVDNNQTYHQQGERVTIYGPFKTKSIACDKLVELVERVN